MANAGTGSGWSPAKVAAFKEEFYDFLNVVTISSKNLGQCILGENLYLAQTRFLDALFDGLAQDKHDIKHTKSRQLGVSTVTRALSLFWLGVHDGLKGAMIYDSGEHKEEARLEIIAMIEGLPPEYDFPRIKRQNRSLLELTNGSTMLFMAAGTRQTKASGNLGRSSGINFCHCSEVSSWDNPEGLESFLNTLSETFDNRLYIWESTGRGFNAWKDMWDEAKADPAHQVCVFTGWWGHPTQRISRDDPDFVRYGLAAPTEKELEKIVKVREWYGFEIDAEQLAWVRRKMDPLAQPEGDAPPDHDGNPLRLQEQPWTEEDVFLQTGAVFFQPEDLTKISNRTVSKKFKTYFYQTGLEFADCRIFPAPNAKSIQLKIWDEPDPDGIYVISVDPAFGANEKNDRSAIQILRVFADGLDQAAEFAWPLINTRQLGWVVLDLMALYGQGRAEIYLIVELNGPGEAVWNEIQRVKTEIQMPYAKDTYKEGQGLRSIFANVRNYIYTRSDSMHAGTNFQWQTTSKLKVTIMERLRDFTSNGMLVIRSADTIEEMRSVTREGDEIAAASNKKDDRVLSLAIGVRCWEQSVWRRLRSQRRTREAAEIAKRQNFASKVALFNKSQMQSYLEMRARMRNQQRNQAVRQMWRGRR